jgi:peptidoglycan lytic transglycosylase
VTLITLLLVLATVAPAAAQEPRLPPPAYPNATLESLDAQAAQRTPDAAPVEALILRARLLSRAGRFRESAEAWRVIVVREPLLSSFGVEQAIRASLSAAEAGDSGGLQAALDGVSQLSAAVPTDILVRTAAAARSAGALDRAIALYKQARASAGRSSAGDQAALGLAGALEQAGDPRGALDVLRELQLTFRQASAYDAADAAARRLSEQLNNPEPLAEQDYEVIADRLSNVAAFRRSVDVLKEWRAAFPDTTRGAEINYAITQSLYSLRANDEARQFAESLIKKEGDGPQSAAAARTLLSLEVREGKTSEVVRRGFAILRGEVAGSTLEQRQSAGRQLGEYLLSSGQAARAVSVFDQLNRTTQGRSARIDLSWRTAIASLRAGNRARAVTELRQLRKLKLDAETDRATSFWLGFALEGSGAHAEAQQLWARLADRFPFSYYGSKAAARRDAPGSASPLAFPDLSLGDSVRAHPDYRIAALLSRAGLLTEAASYARRLSAAFRRDDAAALLAARAAGAADDPSASATIMSSYFGEYLERPATGLPEDFWRLAYPRAYWSDIEAAAARHHVDPLLMVALARQESHFDRTVKSPVGAIGLFQIMPYTAAQLDPSFPVDRADEQLVKPDVAAELAARHLELNLALFNGELAPAIASYNADRERVRTWWAAAAGLPEELFVDSIPYQQTRAYVRQVLANYGMYLRFGGPPASP